MLNLIAITLIFVAVCAVTIFAIREGDVEIGFLLFFSAGYIYYFSTPLLFLANFGGVDIPELEIIKSYLECIDADGMALYGVLSILNYVAFVAGYGVSTKNSVKTIDLSNRSVSKNSLLILFSFSIVLVILAALPIQNEFFRGYSPELFEDYKDGVVAGANSRGTYVASASVLFVLSLMLASHSLAKFGRLGRIIDFLKRPEMLIWYAGGAINRWTLRTPHFGILTKDYPGKKYPRYTDYAPTCFMQIRAELFSRVGMMDETFFVYYDDTDFAWRLAENGFRIRLASESAAVQHKVSTSTGGGMSPFSVFYTNRNRIYFARKNLRSANKMVPLAYIFLTRLFFQEKLPKSLWSKMWAGIKEGFRLNVADDVP